MKTKSRKSRNNYSQLGVVDLFGEVPVTWDEIYEWCEVVGRISRNSPRIEIYIKGWDIVGKIRAAKLSGYHEAILNRKTEVRI